MVSALNCKKAAEKDADVSIIFINQNLEYILETKLCS